MGALGDLEARFALDTWVAMIDRLLAEIALEPGDFCFNDDYKAARGAWKEII
jgi:hypothetical protein